MGSMRNERRDTTREKRIGRNAGCPRQQSRRGHRNKCLWLLERGDERKRGVRSATSCSYPRHRTYSTTIAMVRNAVSTTPRPTT